MAEILQASWIKEAVLIEKVDRVGLLRVTCPECGYEMPIFYDGKSANSMGVKVSCKGRNCHAFFEIKIKDGKQIR